MAAGGAAEAGVWRWGWGWGEGGDGGGGGGGEVVCGGGVGEVEGGVIVMIVSPH